MTAKKPAKASVEAPGDPGYDWSKIYPDGELFVFEDEGVHVALPVFVPQHPDWYRENRRLGENELGLLELERHAKPETFEAARRLTPAAYLQWAKQWGRSADVDLGK